MLNGYSVSNDTKLYGFFELERLRIEMTAAAENMTFRFECESFLCTLLMIAKIVYIDNIMNHEYQYG